MTRDRGQGIKGRGGKSSIRTPAIGVNMPTIPIPIPTTISPQPGVRCGRSYKSSSGSGGGSIGHVGKFSVTTPAIGANMPTIPTPTVISYQPGSISVPDRTIEVLISSSQYANHSNV